MLIFQLDDQKTEAIRELTEMHAAEIWTVEQLIPHVPPQTVERILIERRVNEMDSDFSFSKAVFGDDAKNALLPALADFLIKRGP